jgi:hypothetical protein
LAETENHTALAGDGPCFAEAAPAVGDGNQRQGTKAAMIGVWRPPMAPSVSVDKPDTLARVMIGVAIAPNATGAVLATNARTAALSGLKPRASSITEVTATGVPNPAKASSDAPKENTMMTAWMR